jgi:radical SAM superfamily enzyme YgiQ (UPF0313 family)
MAALLHPDYSFEVVDAIATRMTWSEFEKLLREKQPKYYLTQLTAPTLTNDMYGVLLAKSLGAKTIAFGTHVTPMPLETMRPYPALDFVLQGEPELTLRELVDAFEGRTPQNPQLLKLFRDTDPTWEPIVVGGSGHRIRPDLARRRRFMNFRDLYPQPDLPLPLHAAA